MGSQIKTVKPDLIMARPSSYARRVQAFISVSDAMRACPLRRLFCKPGIRAPLKRVENAALVTGCGGYGEPVEGAVLAVLAQKPDTLRGGKCLEDVHAACARTGVLSVDGKAVASKPFRFSGKLTKLTIKLDAPKLTAEEQKLLDQKTQKVKNARQ
jgi:hypothetical protein